MTFFQIASSFSVFQKCGGVAGRLFFVVAGHSRCGRSLSLWPVTLVVAGHSCCGRSPDRATTFCCCSRSPDRAAAFSCCGRSPDRATAFCCCGRPPDRATAFCCCGRSPTEPLRSTGTVSRHAAVHTRFWRPSVEAGAGSGDPRTTGTRAQRGPAHNWGVGRPAHNWDRLAAQSLTQHRSQVHSSCLSEILVNITTDCLTLSLQKLETRRPLPKTLHKSPGCFPNSSFGLDTQCRL
jgi:hypothetical protein